MNRHRIVAQRTKSHLFGQLIQNFLLVKSRAAIDALDANSALDMGAITKNIERGSTTAASVINMVKLMSQLMRGSH